MNTVGTIQTVVVNVTTTGSAGSASGSTTTEALFGELIDIYLDYHASTPATADVTISFAPRGGNILVVSNNATDGLYAPRNTLVNNANSAITNSHERFVLSGPVTVALAQGDALTNAVVAYIRVGR